jgi:hypothetical protein
VGEWASPEPVEGQVRPQGAKSERVMVRAQRYLIPIVQPSYDLCAVLYEHVNRAIHRSGE